MPSTEKAAEEESVGDRADGRNGRTIFVNVLLHCGKPDVRDVVIRYSLKRNLSVLGPIRPQENADAIYVRSG